MKDHLKEIVAAKDGQLLRVCTAREYLQARMLQSLQAQGAFRTWAFVGGTCLRFLHAIPRFSEDLDFSLHGMEQPLDFRAALARVKADFEAEAYAIRINLKSDKTVAAAFLRFPGLLYDLGLSPHRAQVFSLKVELDTKPPAGAEVETTIVRRHVTLNLLHYDKASLLAGKLHALLTRRYTKGRDLYDLIWYLADRSWPAPNLDLLTAALSQTHWEGPAPTETNWRSLLAERLSRVDWDSARDDVRPFLERAAETELITRETVLSVLKPPGPSHDLSLGR